jgi:hypothetical protein
VVDRRATANEETARSFSHDGWRGWLGFKVCGIGCRLVWLLDRDGPDARLCSDEAEQAVDAVDGPVLAGGKAVAAGATTGLRADFLAL